MSENEKTIIEVNGIKLEVDLRHAKKIENYRIGDNVKVLIKNYDSYSSYPGVIVGFDQFEKLPTIIIAYCKNDYSTAEIKFVYINSESKDIEICHMHEHEKILDKVRVVDYLDKEINKADMALDELKRKKQYFLERYNENFEKAK